MKSVAIFLVALNLGAAERLGNDVIEKFPTGFSKRAAQLRANVSAPTSETDRIRLAEEYLEQGRALGDVGPVSLAESLFERCSAEPNPSGGVLLKLAACKSYKHEFTNALSILGEASKRAESRTEAELQTISILITLGRFPEARAKLTHDPALLAESRAITLLALLASSNGQLRSSYTLLSSKHATWTKSVPEEVRWRLGILAEMEERLGDASAAEARYHAALKLGPPDLFLAAAWLNFLIDRDRRAEALAFITSSPFPDKLKLWRCIASPSRDDAERLEIEFARTSIHLRERALYLLRVKGDPAKALEAALQNWQTQREAIDLRLVLECASTSHQTERAAPALQWIAQTKFEDARLERFLTEARP